MFKKIKDLFYFIFIVNKSGLEKLPPDLRDFTTGIFGWGEYSPKHKLWVIPTLSVKDQHQFETCQWNATIVQKEVDEGIKLSVMKLVSWAKRNGYISGKGLSNLRSGQIALNKYGAEPMVAGEEEITDWNTYSNQSLNMSEAEKHKISSFWSVSSKYDLMKLLDDNRIVTTGIDWFSGFNQGGGFSFPWLILKAIGYLTGGHALPIVGYQIGYQGRNVFILQNSYSKLWGDTRTFTLDDGRKITMSGLLYIDMDYLISDDYGLFTNLDMGVDIGKFLNDYDGKNVKGTGPAIYYIQQGKKKVYPDWLSYLSYNGLSVGFQAVDNDVLSKVPDGDIMDITKSEYWPFLINLKSPENMNQLLEILHKK